jgi:hypothetical protein
MQADVFESQFPCSNRFLEKIKGAKVSLGRGVLVRVSEVGCYDRQG